MLVYSEANLFLPFWCELYSVVRDCLMNFTVLYTQINILPSCFGKENKLFPSDCACRMRMINCEFCQYLKDNKSSDCTHPRLAHFVYRYSRIIGL